MLTHPALSIIVPVYNVEPYLNKFFDALKAQDCRDFEVICIDDGSTDGSRSYLDTVDLADVALTVDYHKRNKGVSATRNRGLTLAKGTYVAFFDADDWVDVHTVGVINEIACRDGADIVVFGGRSIPCVPWIDSVLSVANKTVRVPGIDVVLHENGCVPLMCNKAYRRQLLVEHELVFAEDLGLGEDNLFQFAIFPHAEVVSFCSEMLYFYRCDRNNSAMALIQKNKSKQLALHIALLRRIVALWRESGWLTGREEALLERLRFLFSDALFLSTLDFCKVAHELIDAIDEEIGNINFSLFSLPEPGNFYTLIEDANRSRNRRSCRALISIKKLRYRA